MERKLKFRTYVIVAFITLVIFSLGIITGKVIDDKRLASVEGSLQLQEKTYKSLQFQYLYVSTLPNSTDSCPVLEATLQNNIKDLNKALDSLESYKESAIFNQDEFDLLSQSYILENLRYWILAKLTRDLCETDLITVLYIYSDEDCSTCPDQGTLLTYQKRIFQDKVLIFPINVDFREEEASISLVLEDYSVDTVPSLVIGEDKYESVLSREELTEIMCTYFRGEKPAECDPGDT